MRTTLTIDDDILDQAKALAEHQNRSVSAVVSDLLREALKPPRDKPLYKNGLRILPYRGGPPITLELVNRLRDELP